MGASILTIISTFPGIKDDIDISTYVELAMTQTSSCFYGSRYNQAVALRAAHNLVMSKPNDYPSFFSGGIVMKKQGNRSVQYGRSSGNNDLDQTNLTQTTFGKQLLALMRMSNTTIGAVGVDICGG